MKKDSRIRKVGILLVTIPLALLSYFIVVNLITNYHLSKYLVEDIWFDHADYFIEDAQNIGIEQYSSRVHTDDNKSVDHLLQSDMSLFFRNGKIHFERTLEFYNNTIHISDSFKPNPYAPENPSSYFPEEAYSPIKLIINGKDYSSNHSVLIHPDDFTTSRHRTLDLLKVTNQENHQEYLAIVRTKNFLQLDEADLLWLSKDDEILNDIEHIEPHLTEKVQKNSLGILSRDRFIYSIYPILFLALLIGVALIIFANDKRRTKNSSSK